MDIPPGWAGCTRIYERIVQSALPGRGGRKMEAVAQIFRERPENRELSAGKM